MNALRDLSDLLLSARLLHLSNFEGVLFRLDDCQISWCVVGGRRAIVLSHISNGLHNVSGRLVLETIGASSDPRSIRVLYYIASILKGFVSSSRPEEARFIALLFREV